MISEFLLDFLYGFSIYIQSMNSLMEVLFNQTFCLFYLKDLTKKFYSLNIKLYKMEWMEYWWEFNLPYFSVLEWPLTNIITTKTHKRLPDTLKNLNTNLKKKKKCSSTCNNNNTNNKNVLKMHDFCCGYKFLLTNLICFWYHIKNIFFKLKMKY